MQKVSTGLHWSEQTYLHACLKLCACKLYMGRGGTSSKNHVKKLHPILRYAESSREFTEIKQASTRSVQVCRGTNTLVPRVEHPYNVGKSEKSLDIGEITFHAEKTAGYRLQHQITDACKFVLALSLGPTKKSGKGPGVTCKNSHMCCVSSLRLE